MIKDTNRIPEVIENLNLLNNSQMRAGVLEGGKIHMIAHVQEYGATILPKKSDYLYVPLPDGTFRKLSKAVIPSRPFIAMTVLQNSSKWHQEAQKAFNAAVQGKNVVEYKKSIANVMKNDIKATMTNGGYVANSGLTVLIKGGSTPLINTGGLRDAIDGKVER